MAQTGSVAAVAKASVIANALEKLETEEDVTVPTEQEATRHILQRSVTSVQPTLISGDKALFNLLKGNIGAGILSLPLAFKQGGLWFSFVCMTFLMIANWHCMRILVNAADFLCVTFEKKYLDYGHLAKKAMDLGTERMQRHSRKAMYTVNVFIGVMQVGAAATQLVFITENLEKALIFFMPGKYQMDRHVLMTIVILPIIGIDLIRDLPLLSYFALGGNLLMMIAFLFIFAEIFSTSNVYYLEQYWFHNTIRFLQFFGTVMYAAEAQGELLPLYNRMRNKSDLMRPFGVLDTGMALVSVLFMAVGFFGFLVYGSAAAGSVTLNMPNNTLYSCVNLGYCLALFLGFPLHVYMNVAIIWPPILRKVPDWFYVNRYRWEYVFRLTNVALQYIMAMAIPRLDLIIPLVGSISGISLAIFFPPLLETVVFWSTWGKHPRRYWRALMLTKNLILMGLGVFGVIGGLIVNIVSITEALGY